MKTNTKFVYTYTLENVIICRASALKPNVKVTFCIKKKRLHQLYASGALNFSLRHILFNIHTYSRMFIAETVDII